MNSRVVSATEFKAKCLALLDEIGHTGGTITVTKRGRPMATVGPVRTRLLRSTEGLWKGKVHFPEEQLVADTSDLWEVLRRE
jgi:prevent-host-death family protein